MARTPVLNKEQILATAFTLLSEKGPDAITIRSIAYELGKSTAPIYTQYENMDALMNDLKTYSITKMYDSTKIQRSVDGFLNIGLGILDFALNNKQVFTYYFLAPERPSFDYRPNHVVFLEQMKQNDLLALLGDHRLEMLLDDMWVYTYGIATMICTGMETDQTLDYYAEKLQRIGSQLINYHLFSSGNYEAYIQLFAEKVSKHVSLEEVLKS